MENNITKNEDHAYLVPDYFEDAHGKLIAENFWDLDSYTGGSGLLGSIGKLMVKNLEKSKTVMERSEFKQTVNESNKTILLAGSCSAITLKQIETYQRVGNPSYRIMPLALVSEEEREKDVWEWVRNQKDTPALLWRVGETSGAVAQTLRCSSYYIGESVAPGVPEMIPMELLELRLVLKSGNFGQEDFF